MNAFQKSLHEEALRKAKTLKQSEAQMITILQKVDEASVYLALGFPSMFEYARTALQLSEANAYAMTKIARKAKLIPELKQQIDNGSLTVSKARRILPVITIENHREWIEKAVHLPKSQLEKEVAKIAPEEFKKESLKRTDDEHHSLRMNISEETLRKLKRAQTLLSTKERKNLGYEDVFKAALENLLNRIDPLESKKKETGPTAVSDERLGFNTKSKLDALPAEKLRAFNSRTHRRRAIPAVVKRAVMERDRGKCQYQSREGRTCEETRFTQTHHIREISSGGSHSTQNLTTLCAQHHRFHHLQSSKRNLPVPELKSSIYKLT